MLQGPSQCGQHKYRNDAIIPQRPLWFFAAKDFGGISQVEHRKVQSACGGPFVGFAELFAELVDGVSGVILDSSDADIGFEDDNHQALIIDVIDEQAEAFPLLVDAGEIGFANQVSDRLCCREGGGAQGRESRDVEMLVIAALCHHKAAFIDEHSRGSLAFLEEILQDSVETVNVFLDKLRQGEHGVWP